jgi:hypothetical protein
MLTPSRHRQLWRGLGYTPTDSSYKFNDDEKTLFDLDAATIEARIKEVRDGWTAEERAARLVGNGGRVAWAVPEYYAQYVPGDPTNNSRKKCNRTKIYKRLN